MHRNNLKFWILLINIFKIFARIWGWGGGLCSGTLTDLLFWPQFQSHARGGILHHLDNSWCHLLVVRIIKSYIKKFSKIRFLSTWYKLYFKNFQAWEWGWGVGRGLRPRPPGLKLEHLWLLIFLLCSRFSKKSFL